MKRTFLRLITLLLVAMSACMIVGCGLIGGDGGGNTDYNANVQEVAPEQITDDFFVVEEDTTYYTSEELYLMVEINGAFFELEYFSLDQNKRIYDNVHFYEKDYFFMITGDYKDIYASLGDENSLEYAEEEKEQGYDIQINITKDGIYKVIFDVDTLKFSLEYKAEIQTPVYYTIKNCSIYTADTDWVEMSVNPNNENEFVINNFNIGEGEYFGFFSNIHTSNFKVTLDESCKDTICSGEGILVYANVGGNYNFYINKKTYVVRAELLNPDTAKYACIYYGSNDFVEMQPYDESVPYVFHTQVVVDKKYQNLTRFYASSYRQYKLTLLNPELFYVNGDSCYFKSTGTYNLIINLKTFEISVELMPE